MREVKALLLVLVLALVGVLGTLATRAHGQTSPLGTVRRANLFNVNAAGAGVNIITKDAIGTVLSGGLTASAASANVQITVCLATTSVFSIWVSDGHASFTEALNSGTALTGGQLYAFEFGATSLTPSQTNTTGSQPITYNFQCATNSVVQQLVVSETQNGN